MTELHVRGDDELTRDGLLAMLERDHELIRMQQQSMDEHGAEVIRLRNQIQRVREIHQPHRCRMSTRHIDCSIMFGGGCSREGKCQVCREKYPCATICNLGRVHNGNG